MWIRALALLGLIALGCVGSGCSAAHKDNAAADAARWPGIAGQTDPARHELTVIIAHSSVLPGGIVGHAGIAVDDQYWDFGPQRVECLQPLKSLRSTAGPWWDDPEQQGRVDRSLEQVLDDMPQKIHPAGSLVTILRAQITEQEARQIAAFWDNTYQRMAMDDDRYRLTRKQCASMAAWSLDVGLGGGDAASTRLPRDKRLLTPTRLYESLSGTLMHTAGPRIGQPADIQQWQLGPDGLTPWSRPAPWDRLALPELPRTRLAMERVRFLPIALISNSVGRFDSLVNR